MIPPSLTALCEEDPSVAEWVAWAMKNMSAWKYNSSVGKWEPGKPMPRSLSAMCRLVPEVQKYVQEVLMPVVASG